MTGTNDFQNWAEGSPGTNLMSLVNYEASTARQNGVTVGLADETLYNRAARQAAAIAKLIGDFIADQGLNCLDDGNDAARVVALQNALGIFNYAADTGAANAYVVALSPALAAHVAGMPIRVKIANANTGSSTFNPGPGAKTIVNGDGTALRANQLLAGQVATLIYDGVNYQLADPAPNPVGVSAAVSISTNYTLIASDNGNTFASAAVNLTATLPLLSSVPDGYEAGFQVQNPTLTIAANATDAGKMYGPNNWGVSSIALGVQGDYIGVKKEASTGWLVINRAYSLASTADAQAGTNGSVALTPYAMAGAILGSPSQSWQNVAGSRAANTVYTNTTGRPIMVSVSCGVNAAIFAVNGVTVMGFGSSVSTGVAIVPVNGTYELNATFGYWAEYR